MLVQAHSAYEYDNSYVADVQNGSGTLRPPYDKATPLFELAKILNVYLKFSSINLYAAARGQSTTRGFFDRLLDALGAQRRMRGWNFPNTYDRILKKQLLLALSELPFVSESDRRWLFADTARSLWTALG